jgi:hypothetical protein
MGGTFTFSFPEAEPSGVFRRYLARLGRESGQDTLCSLSRVTANASVDLSDDLDSFLNYALREEDLLFRFRRNGWLLLLPTTDGQAAIQFERLRKRHGEANKNRPHKPLPDPSLEILGIWQAQDAERFANGISETVRHQQATELLNTGGIG